MQTKWDFAGSTDMWSTSAGDHLMKVVNLTGFTVYIYIYIFNFHTLSFITFLRVTEPVVIESKQ
jgi:hypothetical protein